MTDRPNTPLLDTVQRPADMRQMSDAQLTQLTAGFNAGADTAMKRTTSVRKNLNKLAGKHPV